MSVPARLWHGENILKTVECHGGLLVIRFTYHPRTIAQVRRLPKERRFDPVTKAWLCPTSPEAIGMLRSWGFSFNKSVDIDDHVWKGNPKPPEIKRVKDIPGFKGTLKPFQEEGVGFFDQMNGRAFLGDEMGLGKTIQSLAWLQHTPSALPAVVVCPASLKGNWADETKKWTSLKPQVLSGSEPSELYGQVLIINYEILHKWIPALQGVSTIILDEVHRCKNPKTIRTKSMRRLCRKKPRIIALSGTPIINRPVEFWTILHLLAPALFDSWMDFIEDFCDATHNGYNWEKSGSSNEDQLHSLLINNVMLRRKKVDVLKDLPPKQRIKIPLSLEGSLGMIDYEGILQQALGYWDREGDNPSPLSDISQLSKLRLAVINAKFEACCEWIDDFLESGKKLIVYTVHHDTTDLLVERYKKISVVVDGRVNPVLRKPIVNKFQTDPKVQMIIGSIRTLGEGFDLSSAQDVVFIELDWTPGGLVQAEDRPHRITQKGSVTIYYLLDQGTLEDDMWDLLMEKQKVLDAVLDGKEKFVEESIMPELKRRLREKALRCSNA